MFKVEDAVKIMLWKKANKIPNDMINSVFSILKNNNRTWISADIVEEVFINLCEHIHKEYLCSNLSYEENSESALFKVFEKYYKKALLSNLSEDKPLLLKARPHKYLFKRINEFDNAAEVNLSRSAFYKKARVVSSVDENYPRTFKKLGLSISPIYLQMGNIDELNKKIFLLIIGSRKGSIYGERTIDRLIRGLKYYPIIIVSGFAKGMDEKAHRSALDSGLKSIAILPSSLDMPYPNNSDLFERLAESGCLISEYLPGTKLQRYHFLQRNYLLSSMADLVLVVEAGEKSGTLITANYAADQNKTVFAIPGNIDARQSVGSNKLIEEGARICLSSDSLIDEMKALAIECGVDFRRVFIGQEEKSFINMTSDTTNSKLEHNIIDSIESYGMTIEEISDILENSYSLSDIRSVLIDLEIQGKIKREYGRYILTK